MVALHALNPSNTQADWRVFYDAGAHALAGEALYRPEDLPWVYKYAPVTAYVFAPFALLPQGVARWVWVLLTAAMLVRGYLLWASQLSRPLPMWAHVLVLALGVPFFKHLFRYGNCDSLLLWLALESEALRTKRPLASGAVLALACVFKPPLGLLGLVALLAREWKRVVATGAAGLALLALPALQLGPARAWGELQAWRAMLANSTGPMICANQNQSVFGMACWVFSPEEGARYTLLAAGFGALLLGTLAVLLVALARVDPAAARRALTAVALYCTAVLSPLGWRNNLVSLMPLTYLLVEAALRLRSRATWAAALFAPAVATLTGLLAYEVLGRARFQVFLELRVLGVCAAVTAITAMVLQVRAARASSPEVAHSRRDVAMDARGGG
nr:glycosyltransferase family 87 protein [Pyxidicoccus fallax]